MRGFYSEGIVFGCKNDVGGVQFFHHKSRVRVGGIGFDGNDGSFWDQGTGFFFGLRSVVRGWYEGYDWNQIFEWRFD